VKKKPKTLPTPNDANRYMMGPIKAQIVSKKKRKAKTERGRGVKTVKSGTLPFK